MFHVQLVLFAAQTKKNHYALCVSENVYDFSDYNRNVFFHELDISMPYTFQQNTKLSILAKFIFDCLMFMVYVYS